MSWAECKKGRCQGTQAARGHAATALNTRALNAEEQVCALLPKAVGKSSNYKSTKLQGNLRLSSAGKAEDNDSAGAGRHQLQSKEVKN